MYVRIFQRSKIRTFFHIYKYSPFKQRNLTLHGQQGQASLTTGYGFYRKKSKRANLMQGNGYGHGKTE